MIKRIIHLFFNAFGFEIRRKIPLKNSLHSQPHTMQSALGRINSAGISPDCVIDIGAAKGAWSEKTMELWPYSHYILIEPLIEQIREMSKDLKSNQHVEIFEAVAGSEPGHVRFNVSDDLDGSGIYGKGENSRSVKVLTLDEICQGRFESVVLKLDTHGYEIPIFEGGLELLNRTSAIVVEVYGFQVSPTGKLFHEISDYLDRLGFRLFDIVDVMRRPSDNAFWQADAVYLRKNNPIFSDNRYRPAN